MIYYTGDIHGQKHDIERFCKRFNPKREDIMCLSITHGPTERSCDDGKILQTNIGRLLCGFLHEFQQRLLLQSWIRRRR